MLVVEKDRSTLSSESTAHCPEPLPDSQSLVAKRRFHRAKLNATTSQIRRAFKQAPPFLSADCGQDSGLFEVKGVDVRDL